MTSKVRVICDAESHAPKVATVAKLRLYGDAIGDDLGTKRRVEHLIDDRPVSNIDAHAAAGAFRNRWVLPCPLCGLRVELTADEAHKLTRGFLDAGMSQVTLAALAARIGG